MGNGFKFIGRTDEMKVLCDFILSENADNTVLAINGPNEIGKTVLCEHVGKVKKEVFRNAKRIIIEKDFDICDTALSEQIKQKKHREFWVTLAEAFWKQYDSYVLEDSDICEEAYERRVTAYVTHKDKMLQVLKEKSEVKDIAACLAEHAKFYLENFGIRFVVKLDEGDRLQGHCDDFFDVLLGLIKSPALSVILISRRQIENICPEGFREKYKDVLPENRRIRLNGFSANDMLVFYGELEKQWNGYTIGNGVYDRIVHYCGYHPHLLQLMKTAVGTCLERGKREIEVKDIDAVFETNTNELKKVYNHLLDLMGEDYSVEKVYDDRSETEPTQYAELFLRVFGRVDSKQYNYSEENCDDWAKKLFEAGYVYKAGDIEKGNKALYGSMYKDYMSIAPHVTTYILDQWNQKLDALMKKIDLLEAAIRKLLSGKLIHRFGDNRTAGAMIRGLINKDTYFESLLADSIVNGWSYPEDEVYELETLAFQDYLSIIQEYFDPPYFVSCQDSVVEEYMKGWEKNERNTVLNNWALLPYSDRRRLSKMTFTRARNIAKHQNSLNMLNPSLYVELKEECEKLLEDIKSGGALLHEKQHSSAAVPAGGTGSRASQPQLLTKEIIEGYKTAGQEVVFIRRCAGWENNQPKWSGEVVLPEGEVVALAKGQQNIARVITNSRRDIFKAKIGTVKDDNGVYVLLREMEECNVIVTLDCTGKKNTRDGKIQYEGTIEVFGKRYPASAKFMQEPQVPYPQQTQFNATIWGYFDNTRTFGLNII